MITLASLLPLVRTHRWYIRVLDFPRIQMLGVSVVVALLAWIYLPGGSLAGQLAALGLFVAVGLDIYRIYPYMPWAKREVACIDHPGMACVTILSTNIYQNNRDASLIQKLIQTETPDLVVIIEADSWWQQALCDLKRTYTYVIEHPQENTYGLLIYSKLPLKDIDCRYLVDDKVPSYKWRCRVSQHWRPTFYVLHPRPPRPTEGHAHERDGELAMVAKEIQNIKDDVIVVGDLNDVAWSHSTRLFLRLAKLHDPRRGRGIYATFPAKWPWLRFPLDHLFHSPGIALKKFKVMPDVGSDHLPILVQLVKTNESDPEPKNQPEPGDHAEGRRKLAKKEHWTGPNEKLSKV